MNCAAAGFLCNLWVVFNSFFVLNLLPEKKKEFYQNLNLHFAKRATKGKTYGSDGRMDRTSYGYTHCAIALWSETNKNQNVSTGPLARPFARSLAPLTGSLALDCSLRSRPPLRSFPRSWESEFSMSQNDLVFAPQCMDRKSVTETSSTPNCHPRPIVSCRIRCSS